MKRHELEHILRASTAITGAPEIVVIGSQAIHARPGVVPPALVASMEADVFTLRSPEDAALIDGSIGEQSPFHRSFGYYAHGVAEETAILPEGWKQRLVPLRTPETGGATGLCLEAHDLAVSKLVAGREKDLTYVGALVRHGIVDAGVLRERLAGTVMDAELRRVCSERLGRLAAANH